MTATKTKTAKGEVCAVLQVLMAKHYLVAAIHWKILTVYEINCLT